MYLGPIKLPKSKILATRLHNHPIMIGRYVSTSVASETSMNMNILPFLEPRAPRSPELNGPSGIVTRGRELLTDWNYV